MLDSPIVWKHNANWLNGEQLLPESTRSAVSAWAQSYMQAVYNIDAIGMPHPEVDKLPVQYMPELCAPGYAPRDNGQLAAILLAINWGRAALFADMGAGKTFMGGYAAMYWRKFSPAYAIPNSPHRKVTLVVCPKNVIGEWMRQPPEFFNARVSVFPDSPDWYRSDIVVCNYEQVDNLLRYAPLIGGIILDESQKIKNHKTIAFRALARTVVQGNIWHRIVMTGTPQKNKPDDLFSQVSFINPYAFNFSYSHMMRTYFAAVRVPNRREPMYKFKDRWAFLFRDIVTRNAIRMEAPAREAGSEITVTACGMTSEQMDYMKVVEQGVLTVLKSGETYAGMRTSAKVENIAIKNALVKSQQVSSGFMNTGNDTLRFSSEKMAKAYDIVMQEWAEHQVIVWVYFRDTAERLRDAFNNAGSRTVMVRGGMTNKAREEALALFKAGKARVCIAQLGSMNAGLNLQFCWHDLFIELDWAPSTIDQAVARIDRPGQKNRCQHRFLYTSGTTDELLLDAYQSKRKLSAVTVRRFAEKTTLDTVKVRPARRAAPAASMEGAVDKFFASVNKS